MELGGNFGNGGSCSTESTRNWSKDDLIDLGIKHTDDVCVCPIFSFAFRIANTSAHIGMWQDVWELPMMYIPWQARLFVGQLSPMKTLSELDLPQENIESIWTFQKATVVSGIAAN